MLTIDASNRFDLIAAGLIELPKSDRDHVGCLVVLDNFSRWLPIVPIRNKLTSTVAEALEKSVLLL